VPEWPHLDLSPAEMFVVGVGKAGLLRIPASPELVYDFLPVVDRTIQHYGIEVNGLRYNGSALTGTETPPAPTSARWRGSGRSGSTPTTCGMPGPVTPPTAAGTGWIGNRPAGRRCPLHADRGRGVEEAVVEDAGVKGLRQVPQHGPQQGTVGDDSGQVAEFSPDPVELAVDAFSGAAAGSGALVPAAVEVFDVVEHHPVGLVRGDGAALEDPAQPGPSIRGHRYGAGPSGDGRAARPGPRCRVG
jgi:hypothetical protein